MSVINWAFALIRDRQRLRAQNIASRALYHRLSANDWARKKIPGNAGEDALLEIKRKAAAVEYLSYHLAAAEYSENSVRRRLDAGASQ